MEEDLSNWRTPRVHPRVEVKCDSIGSFIRSGTIFCPILRKRIEALSVAAGKSYFQLGIIPKPLYL